jgi:hypothetical protein
MQVCFLTRQVLFIQVLLLQVRLTQDAYNGGMDISRHIVLFFLAKENERQRVYNERQVML